jgi:hypothetical protein
MTAALSATAFAGLLICLWTLGAATRRAMAPDRTAGIPAMYARGAVRHALRDGEWHDGPLTLSPPVPQRPAWLLIRSEADGLHVEMLSRPQVEERIAALRRTP